MTTVASPLSEIASQWRAARRLHVVYGALLQRYALGLPPCRELESPVDRPQPEVIQRVWDWFAQMDARVHVHQLRQLLQTTRVGTEDTLRALIQHHLAKPSKNDADRDKIDFLLVQYLSTCAPAGFYERDVSFEEIAQVLQPIVGKVGSGAPSWLQLLETGMKSLDQLNSLRDLLQNGTLDQMRRLKSGAGEKYFSPTALVAITRFNFIVRRTFVRLIASDLQAIRVVLQELDSRGVQVIDASSAGLGPREPLENVRQICQEWKKPFRAAYAAGQNFRQLIDIRTALEHALTHPVPTHPDAETPMPASPAQQTPPQPESAIPAWRDEHEDTIRLSGSDNGDSAQPSVQLPEETPASIAAQLFPGPGQVSAPHGSASPASSSHAPGSQATSSQASGSRASKSSGSRFQGSNSPASNSPGSNLPGSNLRSSDLKPSGVTWEPVDEQSEARQDAQPAAKTADASEGDALDVKHTAESIAEQLQSHKVKPGSVATITDRDLKLLLSSWEVGAFLVEAGEINLALRHIVAARAILLQQIERRKRDARSAKVQEAIKLAEAEISSIQAQIEAAKKNKDIDAAVNMAATCKRLQALITEAGKSAS